MTAPVIERKVSAFADTVGALTIPNVQITGTDRYLLIATGLNNDDFETVTSVVLDPGGANETALTELGSGVINDDGLVYWHGMVAPPLGTFDVAITLSSVQLTSSALLSGVAVVLSGVHQVSPTRDVAGAGLGGTSGTASITLTSEADDLVLAHSFHENAQTNGYIVTLDGTSTSEWEVDGNHDTDFGASEVATGASTTISWSTQATDWAIVGITMTAATATVAEVTQTHFRVRSDDSVGLNVDSGWAGALDAPVALGPDLPFRARFELETNAVTNQAYRLYYSYNSGPYAAVPDNATWNQASSVNGQKESQVIPSTQFVDGAATTDLLAGSAGAFTAGIGSHSATTPSISLAAGEHTEIEFALLLRKLSDDGHVADGDTFDFQLRTAGGSTLFAYTNTLQVTVANLPGHIGGARVETPLRLMVRTDEDVLYMLSEYADTYPAPVMMKSADGGDTWVAVDEVNAPIDTDLEASDLHYDPTTDTIHISMQGPVSDYTYYWTFRTSGHATNPDTWGIKEEVVVSNPGTSQGSSIMSRSDGTVVIFYRETDGHQTVHYKIRSAGGTWGAATDLDPLSGDVYNAALAIDAAETIHIFYLNTDQTATGGNLFHKTLTAADALSARTQVNTVALEGASSSHRTPMTIPRIWDDGGVATLSIGYASETDKLYYNETLVSVIDFSNEVLVSEGNVALSGGGSHSVTADLVIDEVNDEPHLLWADESTENLMRDVRVNGSWGTDVEEFVASVKTVRAEAFTHSSANGSDRVIGFIWEDVTSGGTGHQDYNEIILEVSLVSGNLYESTSRTYNEGSYEGAIYYEAITLSGTAQTSHTGLVDIPGLASLTSASSVVVSGLVDFNVSSTQTSNASVVVAASIGAASTSTQSAVASTTIAGGVDAYSTAIANSTATLTADGVRAVNATASLVVDTTTSSAYTILEVPQGVVVTGTTESSVTLEWTTASGATFYEIERDGTIVGSTQLTTFTDSGLERNINYDYRVRSLA